VRISPTLTDMATYPFVRLEEERRRLEADGVPVIDFGKGDPNEPTDPRIRQALVENLTERSSYPLAQGLPELRAAVARWCSRRFGVALDPDTEIVPTLGSKEAIFSLAQVLVDPHSEKRLVVYTEPGYPVYERGALFAGAEPLALPLRAENDFLPDLEAVDEETWRRTAILWVNYPNNPTGATASLDFYERAVELAARWDFALASDEAYSELWFDEPPVSALQVRDRRQVVVFQTLSKRSSMTGYRSGFVAAAPEVIAALKAFRPTVGTAPQEFVQRASVVAWDDEEHVSRARDTYARKREILLGPLTRHDYTIAGSRAGMYLWVETDGGLVPRLLERGVVVSPGEFFGPSGAGYVRFALVPTEEECARAAEILEEVLWRTSRP
jgi:succinyldiaminopimelate transaminase